MPRQASISGALNPTIMRKSRSLTSRLGGAALIALLGGAIVLAGCHRDEPTGSYSSINTNDCLPDVTFIDQNGQPVPLSSLKGKPVLVDFIYTTCASVCPRLTSRMNEVAHKLGAQLGQKVTILSFTIDPEHDSPAKLLAYSQAQGATDNGWYFLTGQPAQIDKEMSLFKLIRYREADGSVTHNVSAFLLGPDGHVLREYNALDVPIDTIIGDVGNSLRNGQNS
jgi:protein SCO1